MSLIIRWLLWSALFGVINNVFHRKGQTGRSGDDNSQAFGDIAGLEIQKFVWQVNIYLQLIY